MRRSKNKLIDLIEATQEKVLADENSKIERVLLYVDQMEELYARSLITAPDDSRQFSKLLAEGLQDERLLSFASLRADYFDKLMADEAVFSACEQVNVPPLTRPQFKKVITGPASLTGVCFETEQLPEQITEAAGAAPGALPLLSYLLADMWSAMLKRADGTLRLPLPAIDLGALLRRRADDFLAKYLAAEDTVKHLFTIKLTFVPPDGKPLRRQAVRQDCNAEEWSIAERLADYPWRLVVIGEDEHSGAVTAEAAHEALLDAWPRLESWLEEDRAFLIFKGEMERAERRWRETEKTPAALLKGIDLSRATEWLPKRQDDFSTDVRAFIQDSIASDRIENQRRVRFQRGVIAGAVIALVLLLATGSVAYRNWNQRFLEQQARLAAQQQATEAAQALADAQRKQLKAQEEALNAQSEALKSQSRYLADLAMKAIRGGDSATGILFALAALPEYAERPLIPEAEQALIAGTQRLQEVAVFAHGGPVNKAIFSSDGKRILTGSDDGTARLWDRESGKTILLFQPRNGAVLDVSFSRDGRRVATAHSDGTTIIWDSETGAVISALERHQEAVRSVAFSSDGGRVVTASTDETARIWDAGTGKLIWTLDHQDAVWTAEFSPDDRFVLTTCEDGAARLWDAQTGKPGKVFVGHKDAVWSAKFNRDGNKIVTASRDWFAMVWDVKTGHAIQTFAGHQREVRSAQFSPDETDIVTSSGGSVDDTDNTARLWSAASGDSLKVLGQSRSDESYDRFDRIAATRDGHDGIVWTAVFSPDGQRIVTASADGTAMLWDAHTGYRIAAFRGHGDQVVTAVFSRPDGKQVLTASRDGTARLWDATDATAITTFQGQGHTAGALSAAFSPDGKRIVSTSEDGSARIWDAQSGWQIAVFRHLETVWSAVFSPTGRYVATASEDETSAVLDGRNGQLLHKLGVPYSGDDAANPPVVGHSDTVWRAEFSRDDRRVLTASEDGTARLWDSATGQQLAVYAGHEDAVWNAKFSSDEKKIVTASRDTTARIWDTSSGQMILTLAGHEREVRSATFSPDDRWVVTASGSETDPRDNTARIWNASTGDLISVLQGHLGVVWTAEFSPPDGRYVVTASEDGTARLWDARSGDPLAVLKGHQGAVRAAKFSPDGQRIVTASVDGTARLWDGRSGAPLATLSGHDDAVWSAEFSPDSGTVVTASQDFSVRLWDAKTGKALLTYKALTGATTDRPLSPMEVKDLANFAKQKVPRCLTTDQRLAAFLDREPPQWCIDMRKWPYGSQN